MNELEQAQAQSDLSNSRFLNIRGSYRIGKFRDFLMEQIKEVREALKEYEDERRESESDDSQPTD